MKYTNEGNFHTGTHTSLLKIEVPFMKASEDMDFKDWQKIARVAEKLLNNQNQIAYLVIK